MGNSSYDYFREQMEKREEEDTQNIIEYGTCDPKKIEKIKREREKESRDNRNFWIFIVVLGIVIYMIMGGLAKCTGNKFNPFDDYDSEWQYKHSD